MITDKNNICIYCSLLIVFETGFLLTRIYLKFISAIEANLIVENDLNYCGYTNNSFQFCKSCYNMIIKKKILKLGSANCIKILFC